MIDQPPEQLKSAAIAQIVSGVLNLFFVPTMVWCLASSVCGTLTFFIGGLGGICGLAAWLLAPFGILEIVSGALTLAKPETGKNIIKYVAFAECGSILFGGLLSAIAGGVVLSMLNNDEVAAYIEG